MSKSINWWSVLFFAGMILFVFLYFRSCNGAAQREQLALDHNVHVTDSISKVAAQAMHERDSTVARNYLDSLHYTITADSLKGIINILKGRFSITKDSIGILYNQLKVFYEKGDSVSLVAAYTDLRGQLDQASQQLFQIQVARDSMDYVKSEEIDRLNSVIKDLKGQLVRAFSALSTEIANAKAEENNAQKVLSKRKKAKFTKVFELLGVTIAGIFIGTKL